VEPQGWLAKVGIDGKPPNLILAYLLSLPIIAVKQYYCH